MDTSTVQGRVSATLAENLDARKPVLFEPYVDLSAFAVVLRLDPNLLRTLEQPQRLSSALTLDTLGDLLPRGHYMRIYVE